MDSQKLILNIVTSVWRSGNFLGVLKKSFAPPYLITSFYIISQVKRTNEQITIYIFHTSF